MWNTSDDGDETQADSPTRLPGRKLVWFWQEQAGIDPFAEQLDGALARLDSSRQGRQLLDFLNGVWLGHPLHPLLASLPIGWWSLSALMDVANWRHRRPPAASTLALGMGVAAGIPTALAGAADWHRNLSGTNRRVGAGHALMNSTALVLYVLSLRCRLLKHGPARLLSLAGFAMASASAYLGGHLVYSERASVRRAPEGSPPAGPLTIALPALEDGQLHLVDLDGFPITLAKKGQELYAFGDICPHLGCSLAEGSIEGNLVRCPCHGSAFELRTGAVVDGPAVYPVPVFEVRASPDGAELTLKVHP